MKDFYYIVHATQGDNVGVIQAESEDDATKKLDDIYQPTPQAKKSALISIELITQAKHDKEKERIAAERLAEAERNE